MTLSKNPAFNLKVVLQETNVAADTLRAWERRYGLPMPHRTSGGHRLYSQYDIETIKWLLARQSEGLSISRAVDLWNDHHASGVDPLAGFTPSALTSTLAAPAIYISPDTNLDSLRAQWIAACMQFSESNSEQILNQAFSMFSVEAVCMEILQKGMVEIGNLWYENGASVQQEHFASGLAMRRLDSLLSASPAPTRNQTVLVGCPPNEWHTFTPLFLSLLLRRRGLKVIYLGANVPADRFGETITTTHADLVILVAQTLTTAATLHLSADTVKGFRVPVGFGGRIFNRRPGLVNHIPGYYLGKSIDSSLEEVDKVLKGNAKSVAIKSASKEHLAALLGFISQRTNIEGTVKELVQPLLISPDSLNTGVQFLGDNIAAALQFGDMEHLSDEIEWVKTLLQFQKRPPQELAYFLETYSHAVDKHVNGQGEPIKVWLRTHSNQIT